MNTKLILSASALLLGAAGIAATFAPDEIANALHAGSPILIQLLGAALFGFTMVNWIARGSLIGGIYNRPVLMGNVTHFVIGALALVKLVGAGERRTAFLIATAIYVLFAIAFAMVMFRSPVQRDQGTT